MVEAVTGGIRKSQAYFANTINLQLTENYGQLRVAHLKTGKPLDTVYVKVYARMQDGSVKFFKDGYTDFRGRFDYVSLNTNDLENVSRFSLLIMSEQEGVEELSECDNCHEEKPYTEGEMVVVDVTRVDGMVVSEDAEFVCADCIINAEEAQLERQIEAREWRGYDRWEEQARNGVSSSTCKGYIR